MSDIEQSLFERKYPRCPYCGLGVQQASTAHPKYVWRCGTTSGDDGPATQECRQRADASRAWWGEERLLARIAHLEAELDAYRRGEK